MEILSEILHYAAMATALIFIVIWNRQRHFTPKGRFRIWRNIEPD